MLSDWLLFKIMNLDCINMVQRRLALLSLSSSYCRRQHYCCGHYHFLSQPTINMIWFLLNTIIVFHILVKADNEYKLVVTTHNVINHVVLVSSKVYHQWSCDGTICDSLQFVTAARFVTTECFNLWPGTICDQKCFNLWPALYNDFRVQVVQGKTCFCVYTYNECNMI